MPFRSTFTASAALPKLAWLASVPLHGGDVRVLHGSAVERGDNWLVEGVWDAPFEDGQFHRSEAFFGSGLQVADHEVIASASTAMVDRLFYRLPPTGGSHLLVSNSLVLMLAAIDRRLALPHDYRAECSASLQGLSKQPYALTVAPAEGPPLLQCFHGNLVIADGQVHLRSRSRPHRLDSFEAYLQALREPLAALHANAQSPRRRTAVGSGTTLSSGYDSVAVTCLARELGVRDCYTTRPDLSARGWVALEDGAAIADVLGMQARLLSPPSARTSVLEQQFLAPTLWGSELIFHDMAAQVARSGQLAAIFTGYHGDKVWDLQTSGRYLADDILRGDTSGLNLSEARLACGFFNVAVPFLHARSIRSLLEIAHSQAMKPWQVGSDYDRPIPRRIAESAGVPRPLFGQRKRVVMSYYQRPFNPDLQQRFLDWMNDRLQIGRGRVSVSEWMDGIGWKLGGRLPTLGRAPHVVKQRLLRGHDVRHLMFKWAANDLADRLGAAARADLDGLAQRQAEAVHAGH